MIDVKGFRKDTAKTSAADPLDVRKSEASGTAGISAFALGLMSVALYLRSFLPVSAGVHDTATENVPGPGQSAAGVAAATPFVRSVPPLRDPGTEAPRRTPAEADRWDADAEHSTGMMRSMHGLGAVQPDSSGAPLGVLPFLPANSGLPPFNDPMPQRLPVEVRPSVAGLASPEASPAGEPQGDVPPAPGAALPGEGDIPAPGDVPPDAAPRPSGVTSGESGDDAPGEARNRAPRNQGPVYLGEVGSGGALAIALSHLLSRTADADGDPLSVRFASPGIGALAPLSDGWLYLADTQHLGATEIRFAVSDGVTEVQQTAIVEVVANRISGTSEADLLVGTRGRDAIRGEAGDDDIAALGGDDTVDGGNGDDNIAGGEGDDVLYGGAGDDMIAGGDGNDLIDGGDGNDRLFGQRGDDTILGGAGDDLVEGGDGNDDLHGGDGNDIVLGGDGDDRLSGGEGNDSLDGGAGDDVIAGDAGDDTLAGGTGADQLFAGAGADTLDGGDGDDILWGEADDDRLDGGSGDDLLSGGDGADTVSGGEGDDTVIADADMVADAYFGGAGHDTLDFSASETAVAVDLTVGLATGVSIGEDSFEGFEDYRGTSFADTFRAGTGAGSARLTGNGGDDLYSFAAGDHVDMPLSVYSILDFGIGDMIAIAAGGSSKMIRKLKREVEDEVEDFFERLSDQIDADEPRLKYRHDWTQEYQKTVIDVDFDRDSRTDLTVILEGQHFLTVEHG